MNLALRLTELKGKVFWSCFTFLLVVLIFRNFTPFTGVALYFIYWPLFLGSILGLPVFQAYTPSLFFALPEPSLIGYIFDVIFYIFTAYIIAIIVARFKKPPTTS